ncbi:MAG: hypothetical protein Ct9H300mP10_05990 [Methanobacteriota archaeon]|nr:MAG: hypothetical protein Ct9H300mP10_05990 [Euryarchaeota archaeon]
MSYSAHPDDNHNVVLIESKEDPSRFWEPIGHAVSQYGVSDPFAVASYWAHMFSISVFFVLIPLSKHMHLLMAVPNVFFPRR